MWRQKNPPGNRDSDEILSDDELDRVTYDNDCTKNLQSLYSNQKKVQLTSPVLSRIGKCPDEKKFENFSSNQMMRMHEVQDQGHELLQHLSTDDPQSVSGEESISDEENAVFSKLSVISGAVSVQTNCPHNLKSESHDGACTWSTAIEAVHELSTVLNKTYGCPLTSQTSGARGPHAGDRARAKLKFSFHPLPHSCSVSRYAAQKDGFGNRKSCKDATEGPALRNNPEHGDMENSLPELGDVQEKNEEPSASHDQRGGVPSMTELLEELQHEDDRSMGPPDLLLENIAVKEGKARHARKSIFPHLGSRILDDEDPPEYPGGGLSSEDEDNDQNHLCVATQKAKGHTMAELFQEAFSRSEAEGLPFPTSKQSGIGYHGRLQQVLQVEKERQLELLKHFQQGQNLSDDSKCMDVQILSRVLEAKLTVCQCLFGEYTNSSQSAKGANKQAVNGERRKRMIIFSSKICSNVELEVGTFVRIHPPWKEVQVKENETVILCMYFTALMAGSSSHS